MTSGSRQRFLPGWWACIVACAVAFGALLAAGDAVSAEMRSKRIGNNLCKTTGGGKFVRIPNSNGERIDRRLLPDVRWMQREYKIGVGDGYAPTGHAPQGEHPIGLALDIYSVRGSRGWDKIDKLAKLAEPRPDQPRLPWRWVGYDGDSGHGRGNHLHLSWAHNDRTTPREPAKWVLTRTCPGPGGGGDGGGGGGGGGGGDGDSGGGIGARSAFDLPALRNLAPPVPETR
jgi:hypothetical protein